MNIVTKQFKAEIAHRLAGHPGGCQYIHGHSYTFEVSVAGDLSKGGMVIDFKDLGMIVKEVIGDWDHSLLLDEADPLAAAMSGLAGVRLITFPGRPTAERMAEHLGKAVDKAVACFTSGGIRARSVIVWETETSYATWRRPA